MRVIRIEPIPRRPGHVRVHVRDRQALDLPQVVAEDAGLRAGDVVDDSLLEHLQRRALENDALERALRFLEARPRSEHEVRDRLARKGIPPAIIDTVIDRLRELALVNDVAFAEFWIENRARFNPRGARALKLELRQKGLNADRIGIDVAAMVDESEAAKDIARRNATRLTHLDYPTFRQKMWAFLARRGFDYDVMSSAIAEAWRSIHEEDANVDP